MNYEESYKSRIGLMVHFGEFIKTVTEDQGLEKALEYARTQAMRSEREKPESPLTPREAWDRLVRVNHMTGIDSNVELIGDEVIATNGKCVFYDGWIAAGLTPVEVEKLCRVRFDAYGESLWKVLNPSIEVELRKYKESPEDACLEVLKFKKYNR